MNKVDTDFVDYLMGRVPNQKTSDWISKEVFNYENSACCHSCKGRDVEIIVDTGVVVKCNSCGQFSSENITLDGISAMSYNAVRFLQIEKIIEILEAQGKI